MFLDVGSGGRVSLTEVTQCHFAAGEREHRTCDLGLIEANKVAPGMAHEN